MKLRILTILLVIPFLTFAQQEPNKSKKQIKEEQKKEQIEKIREIVRSKNFVFKAETVNGVNSRTKNLTTDFGVEVRNDSVFSYMPYYGNTYSRDYTSHTDSPMGFIQPIDSYSMKKTNKGYHIDIDVTNNHDVINLKFHINKDGETTLSANSINRSSVSYTGFIIVPFEEPKEESTEQPKN
jgi:hypothetical protein